MLSAPFPGECFAEHVFQSGGPVRAWLGAVFPVQVWALMCLWNPLQPDVLVGIWAPMHVLDLIASVYVLVSVSVSASASVSVIVAFSLSVSLSLSLSLVVLPACSAAYHNITSSAAYHLLYMSCNTTLPLVV